MFYISLRMQHPLENLSESDLCGLKTSQKKFDGK